MNKTLVQEQFGKTAASYLTSRRTRLGKSLERLVALTKPQKDWRALDVATGGGHVAYTFAPQVERVWVIVIAQEMLDMVKGEAQTRPCQSPHRLREGGGAALRGRELRPVAAALRRITSTALPTSSTRCIACSSRAGYSRWSTTWCRPAASATTSTPSSASAIPAICAPGPWTNGARH